MLFFEFFEYRLNNLVGFKPFGDRRLEGRIIFLGWFTVFLVKIPCTAPGLTDKRELLADDPHERFAMGAANDHPSFADLNRSRGSFFDPNSSQEVSGQTTTEHCRYNSAAR